MRVTNLQLVAPSSAAIEKHPSNRTLLIVEQGEGLWGAQRYLLRLAPLLEARGFTQVLAAPADSVLAEAWRESGRQHVVLPSSDDRRVRASSGRLNPLLALREIWRTLRISVLTARLARRVDADAIHANSHWAHFEAVIAGRIARIPSILHLHEENEQDFLGKLRGYSVRSASLAIAVSPAVRDSLPLKARDTAIVVSNGVDAERIQPAAADPLIRDQLTDSPSDPVVLTACRLDPRKGVQHVITAIAALPPALSRVRLAIAGSGSLDPSYTATLKTLAADQLGDRARFLGHREDVVDLFHAADVLALASTLEGMPLGVLEAQAAGLPVVAWPAAGIPELIDHGVNGLIAEYESVEDLTRQLATVLSEPKMRERMAEAARESVLANHTLEGQADEQAALLRELFIARD